jgi:hypothetical protein
MPLPVWVLCYCHCLFNQPAPCAIRTPSQAITQREAWQWVSVILIMQLLLHVLPRCGNATRMCLLSGHLRTDPLIA